MKRVLAILLLVLLLTAAMPATSLAAKDVRAYRVTASTLHLRTGPGTSYKIIAWMPTYTPLTVVSKSTGKKNWWKVKTLNGMTGYASKNYIAENAFVNVNTKKSGLNVHKKPSASSTWVMSLPHGAKKIKVTYINGNWAKVVYNSKTGYASRNYLKWYKK